MTGVIGDGVSDDSDAFESFLNGTRQAEGVWPVTGRTIKVTRPLRIRNLPVFRGPGGHAETAKVVATAGVGTGAVFDIDPGISTQRGMRLSGFSVDLSAAPYATGIRLNNVDRWVLDDILIRGGAVGFDFAVCSQGSGRDLTAYNQTDAMFRARSNNCVSNDFLRCLAYQTSGATASTVAGWDVTAARDLTWQTCRVLRAPGTPRRLAYGWRVALAPGSFGGFMWSCCEADAVTDLTADTGRSAAVYLENAARVQAVNNFLSANSAGSDAPFKQPALHIKGGTDFTFANNRYSGRGVRLRSAADLNFTGCRFVGGSAQAFDLSPDEPTTLLRHSGLALPPGMPLTNLPG